MMAYGVGLERRGVGSDDITCLVLVYHGTRMHCVARTWLMFVMYLKVLYRPDGCRSPYCVNHGERGDIPYIWLSEMVYG